ncbi:MAG: metal-dependent transcriptional regulator [Arachnia sp.]
MSVSDLSPSAQDYLKVIWGLQEWSDEPVTASMIAAKSGMKLSTVSGAVTKLAEQGFATRELRGDISLTERGHTHAMAMVRRHRLLESFLVDVLGYGWDEVHDEAENLEHAVSDLMVTRMDNFLGHPTRDPHGDPIPPASGHFDPPVAMPLSSATPDTSVLVERIADDDPELLRFFADRGITVGARLQVEESTPYSDALTVRPTNASEVSLGLSATRAVWVSPVTGDMERD